MDRFPLRVLIVEDGIGRQKVLKDLFGDHAWIVVNTARRATRLISAFEAL